MREKAEQPDTIVDCHQHDTLAREVLAVAHGIGTGTRYKTTPRDPHHHRQVFAPARGGCPDVQSKAILAHRTSARRTPWKRHLHGIGTGLDSGPNPRPRRYGDGRAPSQLTKRRRGKRDSLEDRDLARDSGDAARSGLDEFRHRWLFRGGCELVCAVPSVRWTNSAFPIDRRPRLGAVGLQEVFLLIDEKVTRVNLQIKLRIVDSGWHHAPLLEIEGCLNQAPPRLDHHQVTVAEVLVAMIYDLAHAFGDRLVLNVNPFDTSKAARALDLAIDPVVV